MKIYRKFTLLALALALLLAVSALAAGSNGEIEVIGSNGTVTAGIRTVKVPAGTPVGPLAGTDTKRELVYTTDGVNWLPAQTPEEFWYAAYTYYAGGRFWIRKAAYSGLGPQEFVSEDGIHWTKVTNDQPVADRPEGMADLGNYHFELGEGGALWMTHQDNSMMAAEIPAFRSAQEKSETTFFSIKAYYGPNETVILEACDWNGECLYNAAYSISSLEWVMENQAKYGWIDFETKTTNGSVTLGQRKVGGKDSWYTWDIAYSYDDIHYAQVPNAPWGSSCELLPYNGRTFVVLDHGNAAVYVSEDGVNWRNLMGTYLCPALPEEVDRRATLVQTRMQWTGTEYITCQRVAEGVYGMVGTSGGWWYDPISTKVCFADENFNLTGSYDFGRQVVGVGYYNGAWYAQVKESEAMTEREYDDDGPTALYVSKDKQTWSKTDIIQIMESVDSLGEERG